MKLLSLAILFVVGLLSGCSTAVFVDSAPRGARILVNGNDTNLTTPVKIKRRDLSRFGGQPPYKIEVVLAGYPAPAPQFTTTTVAVGRIVWSVILPIPIGIINVFRGFSRLEPGKVKFILKK